MKVVSNLERRCTTFRNSNIDNDNNNRNVLFGNKQCRRWQLESGYAYSYNMQPHYPVDSSVIQYISMLQPRKFVFYWSRVCCLAHLCCFGRRAAVAVAASIEVGIHCGLHRFDKSLALSQQTRCNDYRNWNNEQRRNRDFPRFVNAEQVKFSIKIQKKRSYLYSSRYCILHRHIVEQQQQQLRRRRANEQRGISLSCDGYCQLCRWKSRCELARSVHRKRQCANGTKLNGNGRSNNWKTRESTTTTTI